MFKLGRIFLAQQIIFGILVFLIPSQLGYHFWPPSSHVYGIRVDYFAPTIYLTDFLVLTLVGLFILERLVRKKPVFEKKDMIYILLLLILALMNIAFATSTQLSLVKWAKIVELFFLGLYIKNQEGFKMERFLFPPLILSGILFSSIGIAQFILQKTLGGPLYLFGERAFSALTPGIALGDYFGFFGLRAYSTFSHPNSFAAFLGFLLIAGSFFRPGGKTFKIIRWLVLFLGIVGLYLTLSRWVFVSLLTVFLTKFLNTRRLFHIGEIAPWLLGLVVIVSLLLPIFSNELLAAKNFFSETLFERLYLAKRAGEIVMEKPTFGVGLNNYILSLPLPGVPEFSWRLQPVHNIFLLVFAEGGVVGLLGLTFVLWKGLQNSSKSLPKSLHAFAFWTLLFIIFSGLADHYWLTLQQNQIILALTLGISLRKT